MSIALPAFGPTDIDNPAAAMVMVDQQSQMELGLKHKGYTFPVVTTHDYVTGEEVATDPSLDITTVMFGLRAAAPRLTPKFLREYGNTTIFVNLRTPPGPSVYPIIDPNIPEAYSIRVEEDILNLQLGVAFPLPAGFAIGLGGHQVATFYMPVDGGSLGLTGEIYSNPSYGDTLYGDITMSLQTNEIPFIAAFLALPMFGLSWDVGQAIPALDGLRFGFVHRARHEIPFDMEMSIQQMVVDLSVQGEEVSMVSPTETDPETGEQVPSEEPLLETVFPTLHMVYIPSNTGVSLGWDAPRWRTEVSVRKRNYSQMTFGYFGVDEELASTTITGSTEGTDGEQDIEITFTMDMGFANDWADKIVLRDVYEWNLYGAIQAANFHDKAPLWIEARMYYRPSYIVSQEESHILDPAVFTAGLSAFQTIPFGDGYGVDVRLGFDAGKLRLENAGRPGSYAQPSPDGFVFGGGGTVTYRF